MELQRACLPRSIAAVVGPSDLVTRHDCPICSMSSGRNPYDAIFSFDCACCTICNTCARRLLSTMSP